MNSALVLLPDTYHLNPNPFLAALNEELGEIPLVGGGASEDGSQGRAWLAESARSDCNQRRAATRFGVGGTTGSVPVVGRSLVHHQ